MTAIELAEQLQKPLPSGTIVYGLEFHSAEMLRKQDAAIKTLREALKKSRDYAEEMGELHYLEDDALAATEEFK